MGGYELLDLLGKGGMGTVYRARGPLGRIVAVKVLAPHLTGNDVLRTRFYLEAKLAMALEHPNIVRALEVGEDNSQHYLVMEYIDGESVNKKLARDGALSEEEVTRIAIATARALNQAHEEGLVHRDVKPDNILITRDGGVKLTDLGLAKKAEIDLDLTRTGKGLGTPQFMSPEQFRDAKSVDPRSDIYALGATIYVMVTGRVPFRGRDALETFMKKTKNLYTPVEEILPNVDRRLLKVIRSSMSADPAHRPHKAKFIADYLEKKIPKLPVGEQVEELVELVETVWYVKFDEGPGNTTKIKGPESVIRNYIAKGKIGPGAVASPHKRGPYQPIALIPEFEESLRSAPTASAVRGRPTGLVAGTSRGGSSPWGSDDASWKAFLMTTSIGFVLLLVAGWFFLFQK